MYANGVEYGVTSCAPILDKTGSESDFFGAMCLDRTPGGDIDRYFDFGEDKFQAAYLLFNRDAAFRREDYTNSTFQDSFENIFVKSIERSNPGVEIKQASPVELNHDFARLYGGELLNWGMVRVTRT